MTLPTFALSLRQPWAAFVLHHGKRVENRRWNTLFRGEFLIHAAKGMTDDEYRGALEMLDGVNGLQPVDVVPKETLQRGGFVGVARVVDVVPPRPEILIGQLGLGLVEHYPEELREGGWRWHMREQFGFVLRDVRPLPFVPYPGSLNFFRVPEHVVRQLEEAAA